MSFSSYINTVGPSYAAVIGFIKIKQQGPFSKVPASLPEMERATYNITFMFIDCSWLVSPIPPATDVSSLDPAINSKTASLSFNSGVCTVKENGFRQEATLQVLQLWLSLPS